MLEQLTARAQSWALKAPFRISRGEKHTAEVVVAEVVQAGLRGHGESVPYARYGESVDSVLRQIEKVRASLLREPRALHSLLPPGAARNAVDCALWDLRARQERCSVARRLGMPELDAMPSAVTIGIDVPTAMYEAARRVAGSRLLKVKVDAIDPEAQIAAVRRAAPQARLIVDPNESWSFELLESMQHCLAAQGVELLEQPLPGGQDAQLEGFRCVCSICADESCHVASDLPALAGRYQAVNIKLDKSGGLTTALELLGEARRLGMKIMVGCMVCTSLGIAPALHVARLADFTDLDGPWWLRQDREGGVHLQEGILHPPAAGFWGDG